MTLYALALTWAAAFALHVLLRKEDGIFDEVALWTFCVLTLVLIIRLLVSVLQFVKDLGSAAKQGNQILTEKRIKFMLIGGLAVGLACRIVTWGSGDQGVAGWVGALLVCLSLIGLGIQYVRRARSLKHNMPVSYWHPYSRAVLLTAWVASLISLGAVKPTGVIGALLVALFWLSLVALVIQIFGERFHHSNGHR